MIDLNKIGKGMDVLTSDGHRLGTVRELVGTLMFLDGAEGSHGKAMSVPVTWIIENDEAVRLAKSRDQVEQEWRAGPETSL